MRRYVDAVLDNSLLLLGGAIAALVWINVAGRSYTAFAEASHFVVNDVAMVFFFALATKEIVEATLPGGALSSRREAAVPLLAAAGGMLVPAVIYAGSCIAWGYPELLRGWAIPCATDIAFSYLVARLVFPRHHPAIPFLLLLAVADDALGLVLLALFYPARALAPIGFIGLIVPAVLIAWLLRKRRVHSFWPYVTLSGTASWIALYVGGLHPALALVPIVPFMPAERRYHELFDPARPRQSETLNRFAEWWRVPVQLILFLFGLTNAGVLLSSVGPATWLVTAALLVGKPAGILGATVLAVAAGLKRPGGISYVHVGVVGVTAAIGFTVALFFATAAFPRGAVLDEAKMGALLSFVAAPIAIALGCSVGLRPRSRQR